MSAENAPKNRIVLFIRDLFLKNVGWKITALFFAIILWGVVLTTQNPLRVKTIQDVPVSFTGEYDLLARDLVVRGHPLETQGGITVRVSTPIVSYRDFTAENITANINLSNVMSPGIKSLPVNAYTSRIADSRMDGTYPERIEIEIDTLLSKKVPVEAIFTGELPDGYWNDTPELNLTEIDIRGPKTDVQRVRKAVCYIPRNITSTYNESVDVVLLDSESKEVDSSYFLGELPSVVVHMRVLPKKTVPVDIDGSIVGIDSLPVNYEITAKKANPETVDIVGEASLLAQYEKAALQLEDPLAAQNLNMAGLPTQQDGIMFDGLNVSGRKETVYESFALTLPDGISLVTSSGLATEGKVDVTVEISEVRISRTFEDIPIQCIGLPRGQKGVTIPETVDVTITGRISLINQLDRGDIRAFVDLTGLNRQDGSYIETLKVTIKNDDVTNELQTGVRTSAERVTVLISKK